MTDVPQVLLAHHLKVLKLPTFLREHDKLARQCAAEGVEPYPSLPAAPGRARLYDRERRMVEQSASARRASPR